MYVPIRLSLLAAFGSLLLSVAPALAAAPPTPTATVGATPTVAPRKEPAIVSSPSPGRGEVASPAATQPSVTPSPTPTPSPSATSTTTGTPTPRPSAGPSESPTPEPTDAAADVDWRAFVPTDTADHLATMDRAARESGCGVPWQLLAAIARIESDFGRNMSTSTAGAIGYGQFLPSSWQAFGSDGNAYDYRDALPAIALYLCQSGLERDPRAALFAYNHADWYVDLVLNLAVEYDRMAPGGPTPDVLNVGPRPDTSSSQDDGVHYAGLNYARGRDTRLQARARTVESSVRWLGVPWRGRTAGQPISGEALEATTLSMVRLGFGLSADVPTIPRAAGSDDLGTLATAAWDAGLLGLTLPQQADTRQATVGELRRHLASGQPVVIFVGRAGLPGHRPTEDATGEQPLLLIGTTPDGFIYDDPSFSSSLGYGLQMSEADLTQFWDTATRPRQALAFIARPRSMLAQAHLAQPQPPAVIARVLPTPTPLPATDIPLATPTATLVLLELAPTATPRPVARTETVVAHEPVRRTDDSLLDLTTLLMGVIVVRRLRAGL